jgi:hypothetical protein
MQVKHFQAKFNIFIHLISKATSIPVTACLFPEEKSRHNLKLLVSCLEL